MYTITSSAGNVIEITHAGNGCFAVSIDGKSVAKAASLGRLGRPMEAGGKTVVAVIEFRKQADGKKAIGLSAKDVAAMEAMIESERTDEERAAIAFQGLRSEREELVRAYNGHIADAYPDNLYDSEYEHINRRRQAEAKQADARIEPARIALAEFDAAHPDVIASIKAEEAASVERNRWM